MKNVLCHAPKPATISYKTVPKLYIKYKNNVFPLNIASIDFSISIYLFIYLFIYLLFIIYYIYVYVYSFNVSLINSYCVYCVLFFVI